MKCALPAHRRRREKDRAPSSVPCPQESYHIYLSMSSSTLRQGAAVARRRHWASQCVGLTCLRHGPRPQGCYHSSGMMTEQGHSLGRTCPPVRVGVQDSGEQTLRAGALRAASSDSVSWSERATRSDSLPLRQPAISSACPSVGDPWSVPASCGIPAWPPWSIHGRGRLRQFNEPTHEPEAFEEKTTQYGRTQGWLHMPCGDARKWSAVTGKSVTAPFICPPPADRACIPRQVGSEDR